jgi:hypothetical protein
MGLTACEPYLRLFSAAASLSASAPVRDCTLAAAASDTHYAHRRQDDGIRSWCLILFAPLDRLAPPPVTARPHGPRLRTRPRGTRPLPALRSFLSLSCSIYGIMDASHDTNVSFRKRLADSCRVRLSAAAWRSVYYFMQYVVIHVARAEADALQLLHRQMDHSHASRVAVPVRYRIRGRDDWRS